MSIPESTQSYRLPKYGGGIDSLVLQKGPVAGPNAGEVLVKIHAVSIQYRDLIILTGYYPAPVKPDLIPASDCAGEVIAIGPDVDHAQFQLGDRVMATSSPAHIHGPVNARVPTTSYGGFVDGVLTEYKVFPAAALLKVPEHLSYEEAATLPGVALTAYNALMGPQPLKGGDTVLVMGTGGVSIFALQFAVVSGATVIVTSSSDSKLAIAKKLGAHHLINYRTTPNWEEEVMKATNGEGATHIVEVGGPGTLAKSFKCVAYGGWIHAVGFIAHDPDAEKADPVVASILRGCSLRGVLVGSVAQFKDMSRLVSATRLKPVVDTVFSFADTKKAFACLAGQEFVGKIVIKVVE